MAEQLVDINAHIDKRVHLCRFIWKDNRGRWIRCKHLDLSHPGGIHEAKGSQSWVALGAETRVVGAWAAEGLIR